MPPGPSGYTRHDEVRAGGAGLARDCGLWLSLDDAAMIVERLPAVAAMRALGRYGGAFGPVVAASEKSTISSALGVVGVFADSGFTVVPVRLSGA